MCQPAAARAWAVARPMPRLDAAPGTMGVLSVTDMVVLPGLVVLRGCGRAAVRPPARVGLGQGGGGGGGGGRGGAGGGPGVGPRPGGALRQAVAGVGSAAQGTRGLPPSSVLIRVTTASVDRP